MPIPEFQLDIQFDSRQDAPMIPMNSDKVVTITFPKTEKIGTPPIRRSTYIKKAVAEFHGEYVIEEKPAGQFTIVATFQSADEALTFRLKCT